MGRTAVQKIVYFLQIVGVPMRYRFDIHHYGPYCSEISRDLEWLRADEVIADHSQNTDKYSNYRPGGAIDELVRRHADDLRKHGPLVQTVVRALLPLRPERLELLATLHYVYREQKARGGTGPWKDRVLARFREVKKDKFQADDVSHAYETLVSVDLLEP